jgi:lysophospholipase L1-like esterase
MPSGICATVPFHHPAAFTLPETLQSKLATWRPHRWAVVLSPWLALPLVVGCSSPSTVSGDSSTSTQGSASSTERGSSSSNAASSASGTSSSSPSGSTREALDAAAADTSVADASHDAAVDAAHDASTVDATSGVDSGHTGPWRIMPLGDSITGSTCYPQLLSKELIAKGHTNFTFIGTNLNDQGCGTGAPNVMTEGHGGYDVTYLTTNSPPSSGHGTLAELQTWAAEKPDVVLMQYGTNDVWNGYATASILSAYSFVVGQFRSQNPNVIFFVAQILPMHPAGCDACESGVETLNSQIPGWASGEATVASPIHVVNVWSAIPEATYLPNSTDTTDGVHPTPAGAQPVADVWYTGITAQGLP